MAERIIEPGYYWMRNAPIYNAGHGWTTVWVSHFANPKGHKQMIFGVGHLESDGIGSDLLENFLRSHPEAEFRRLTPPED